VTFLAFENSVESSQPLELYEFTIGGTVYRYTSAEDTFTFNSLPYSPVAMYRDKTVAGREERSSNLTIYLPASDPFSLLYTTIVPGRKASLVVKRLQRLDTPTPQSVIIFEGTVQNVSFEQQLRVAKVTAVPLVAANGRHIPRFSYQGLCNHVLYDARCKINALSFKTTGTVSAVSFNVITVPGLNVHPDGYYDGGFVEAGAGTDDRLILHHAGNNLTLLLPFPFGLVGSSVDCYAGCAHDPATCDFKFANVVNYGGFFFIPTQNPFNTGLIAT